jgi:hypothetical protein
MEERDGYLQFMCAHSDPVLRWQATTPAAQWERADMLVALFDDPSDSVRKFARYALKLCEKTPSIAARLWDELDLRLPGTSWNELLASYVHHSDAAESIPRLVAIAMTNPSQSCRHEALAHLVELDARDEIFGLLYLLKQPPTVNWSVHILLLDACKRYGFTPPWLPSLDDVDNVHLAAAVAACTAASQ